MYSTVGRPRKVTDAQVKRILMWHASRRTLAQFSKEIGLSESVVQSVISRGGRYKQPSPDERVSNVKMRGRHLRRMHAEGWL